VENKHPVRQQCKHPVLLPSEAGRWLSI